MPKRGTQRESSKCKHGPTNTFMLSSPIGELELECCPRGIHKLTQPSVNCDAQFHPEPNATVEISRQLYQDNGYTYKPALTCVQWLHSYFHSAADSCAPQPTPPICHLNTNGTASFTKKVWQSLTEKVQFGQTVSYGELAELSGSSLKASRAVGTAMRTNPVMIIIPCHRVILSSGLTGNYSGGKKNSVKLWLLRHEGVL